MPDETPKPTVTPAGNGVRTGAATIGSGALVLHFLPNLDPTAQAAVIGLCGGLASTVAQWARGKAKTLPEGSFQRLLLQNTLGQIGG